MTSSSPSFTTLLVTASDHGVRLDKFLVLNLQGLSRSRLSGLVTSGYVKSGDKILTEPAYKVKEGQAIEVTIPPAHEAIPLPQEIPLNILYEDNDVIVINKPPGLVVHPAPGNPQGTLVNALLSHCGQSLSGIGGVKRPGIVHRLDKETSGILVAAKNDKAHHGLAHQLAAHTMHRVYHALVWGKFILPIGSIEGAIGRDLRNRQRMTIRMGGKFARTHYKVLKVFGTFASLVECRLETGRTHQIRVHLTSKGHPLIGDVLYGRPPRAIPSDLKTYLAHTWPKGRHALHASELSFSHPITHEKLHFSTDLPQDMKDLIEHCNNML